MNGRASGAVLQSVVLVLVILDHSALATRGREWRERASGDSLFVSPFNSIKEGYVKEWHGSLFETFVIFKSADTTIKTFFCHHEFKIQTKEYLFPTRKNIKEIE